MFFAFVQVADRIESAFVVEDLRGLLIKGRFYKKPCYTYSRREFVHELCTIPIFQLNSVTGIHAPCCTAGIAHGGRYAWIGNNRCNLVCLSRLLIGRIGKIAHSILLGACTVKHNQPDFCRFLDIDFYIYIISYIFRIMIFHRCASTRLNENFADII